ncbi:MAG: threonylcarbamoyl-AMP synthase [Candidatus Hydrogenedentes bacterium]|nr:threonylcarbamoyl-AMP synthase [Candidatus Hydrogenedentota bacterium]
MKRVAPDSKGIQQAVQILRAGGIVAYPTETVYGLGVDPFSDSALAKLFTLKERDIRQPVLLIVADEKQARAMSADLSEHAALCMRHFWPGPLSLVLPASSQVSGVLLDDQGRICLRCPGHAVARALCHVFGSAITSTSANISGQRPATNADAAALPGVDFVLDGGVLPPSLPSTVYDPDAQCVLREGPITIEMIATMSLNDER